jgi:hypothetical protein
MMKSMTKLMNTMRALPSPHTDGPSSSTNDPEVIELLPIASV